MLGRELRSWGYLKPLHNRELRSYPQVSKHISDLHIEKTSSKYRHKRHLRPEAESCQADCLESGMGRVCFEPAPWLHAKYFWNFHPKPWGKDPIWLNNMFQTTYLGFCLTQEIPRGLIDPWVLKKWLKRLFVSWWFMCVFGGKTRCSGRCSYVIHIHLQLYTYIHIICIVYVSICVL